MKTFLLTALLVLAAPTAVRAEPSTSAVTDRVLASKPDVEEDAHVHSIVAGAQERTVCAHPRADRTPEPCRATLDLDRHPELEPLDRRP